MKLTDKCLNNAMESPIAAATWLPADMKSNILKAQVEAGHKVNNSADESYSVLRWLFRTGCEEPPRSGSVRFPCLTLQLCGVGEGALQIGVLQELRSKEWQNKEACQPYSVTGVQFAQGGIVIPFGAGESPEQSNDLCTWP